MNLPPRGRAATSAAIERTTLDLILEHGYDNVTVDMICAEVGISQRTFFNYFPTKDDAILGRDMPEIDQQASRRFVLSDGPLLLDSLTLIIWPSTNTGAPDMNEKVRVMALSPTLIAKLMERFATLENELKDIIGLRLEHQRPDLSETERTDEAVMVTHLLIGIMRFVGMTADGTDLSVEDLTARLHSTLAQVLADSSVPGTTDGG